MSSPSIPVTLIPTAAPPYFHVEALQQRFAQDLTDAVLVEHIDEDEARWLRTLLNSAARAQAVDPPRVDRVIMTSGVPAGVELAAAVLISHEASSNPLVYLSTLLYGLEPFKDREQLLATLQARFGSRTGVVPEFDEQLIEGPLFEQRMLTIIDQQAEKIDDVAAHLQQLPSLQTALCEALKQRIATVISGAAIDPSTHLLQIVQATTQPSEAVVVGVQTLADATLDEYIGRAVPQGHERRFLNSRGQTLVQQETQQYQQALSDTAKALQAPFENLLRQFWDTPVGHGQTRREYAADVLSDRFRQELFARRQDAILSDHEFRRLSTLLDPAVAQWGDGGPIHVKKLTLAVDDQDPLKLASAFLIESVVPHLPEVLFYSLEQGLRRLSNRLALQDYFSTAAGRIERLHYLSLNDHALLRGANTVQLNVEDIDRPLFQDRIDSIIALQQRNLAFAITKPHKDRERAAVMIDDALDIRRLIDHRLLRLGGGRWREGEGTFDDTWLQTPSVQPRPAQSPVVAPATPLLSWLERVQTLDDSAQRVWQAHPGIESCARDVLNKQLSVLSEGRLDASDIQVQLIEVLPVDEPRAEVQSPLVAASPAPIGLIALLLNRVSGHRLADVPVDSQILIASPAPSQTESATLLTPLLINHLLARSQEQFSAAYTRQTTTFHSRALRQADSQLHPGAVSCDIREALLRIELDLARRQAKLDEQALGMLDQVLNYPVRNLREVFGDAIVDVYAVALIYGDNRSSALMTNFFVLHQTFGVARSVVLWSPFKGLHVFDSLDALKQTLISRMTRARARERWLDLFAEPDKARIRQDLGHASSHQLSIDLQRRDEHFIQQLQHAEQDRQYRGVERACQFVKRGRFEAELFSKVTTSAETDDKAGLVLDAVSIRIYGLLFQAFMPAWMKTASDRDLLKYAEILKRYYLTNDPNHDFLFGIPYLTAYAREQVLRQLDTDFPGQSWDPDTLQITLTQYVSNPVGVGQTPSLVPAAAVSNTETLTEYALNHFSSIQGASLTVTSADGGPALTRLTPAYLKQLIRTLDVGASFQGLLAQRLDKSNPDYLIRKKFFFQQWPALILEAAFEQKLNGLLSDTANDCIESVFDMPDSLARQTVNDEDIILRPLQLIAKEGATPDTVPGCYLICPKDPVHGPLVLHVIFNQAFTFKEYADEAQLLQDIRTSNSLQALFMGRVTPDVQARYGHRSFHLPPVWSTEFYSDFPMFSLGPVTLHVEPIQGNVLQYLLEDTIEVLQDMAKKQTVTTAQADWEAFTYLMTLEAEQVLMFLPGRLGMLVAAWQSVSLFQASAASAVSRRWGKALSEFTAALSVFVSTRQSAIEESVIEDVAIDEPELETHVEAEPLPEFSWRHAQLPAEFKTRLQAFEVPDIALSDLSRDELYNVYQDLRTHKTYAAVTGKVYQVQQFQGQWSIVSADKKGPAIRINPHQQWELNLQWGLRGGGNLLTHAEKAGGFTRSEIDALVDQEFTVEATGMTEMRTLFRGHAFRIGQAHQQAKLYLDTCLDNLNFLSPNAPLDARANRIISEFFGVGTPSARLVDAIRQSVTRLFNAVMDASLAPISSSRYVMGFNKVGYQDTVAFTVKADPLQRVFLSERFFRIQRQTLKPHVRGSVGFDQNAHYRGATLIHELSHLTNDTYDIAYVGSAAPYRDLLLDGSNTKADLEETQQRYLSHLTSPNQLFKLFERNRWRDLNDDDQEGKQFILSVTGKTNLADARAEFMANVDKRSRIMLKNADSLTLLVTLLGRESFVPVA